MYDPYEKEFVVAPWDVLVKLLTGVMVIFPIIIGAGLLFSSPLLPVPDDEKTKGLMFWMVFGVLAITEAQTLILYLFSPQKYVLSERGLEVKSVLRTASFALEKIRGVEQIQPELLKNSTMTFGCGGICGYFGYFSKREVGNYRLYATRKGNLVKFDVEGKHSVIVTPDDVDGFLEAYLALKKQSSEAS